MSINKKEIRQKFPYKKLLDALVLSKYQIGDISEKLREHKLVPIPDSIEEEVRAIMTEYKIQYGTELIAYPEDIKRMLSSLQMLPGSGPYIKEAFEILNDIPLRRWIQSMAMANLDFSMIYLLVSTKTDKVYDEGVFQAFINYFFNLDGFSAKEKNDLLLKETDASLKEMYSFALTYDKNKMLWKMGFTPDMSVEEIVKIVAIDSVMRFKNTFDDDKAAKLGTLVLKAADKMKEIDGERKKSLENSANFNINILKEKPNFKTISDLEEEL